MLPLVGSFFSGLFGRVLGRNGSVMISIFCMSLVTVLALTMFYQVCSTQNLYYVTLGS